MYIVRNPLLVTVLDIPAPPLLLFKVQRHNPLYVALQWPCVLFCVWHIYYMLLQSLHIGLYVVLHVTPSFRLPSVSLRFRPASALCSASSKLFCIPAVSTFPHVNATFWRITLIGAHWVHTSMQVYTWSTLQSFKTQDILTNFGTALYCTQHCTVNCRAWLVSALCRRRLQSGFARWPDQMGPRSSSPTADICHTLCTRGLFPPELLHQMGPSKG